MEKVAILGASANPERYAHKAFKMLQEYGHQVFLVNPGQDEIEGQKCFKSLAELPEKMDTITVYVGPQHQGPVIDQIIKANPKRVILNPGTEGKDLISALEKSKIENIQACTLVLLRTGQY